MAGQPPFKPKSYLTGKEIAPNPNAPLIMCKVSDVFLTKPNANATRRDKAELPLVAYFTLAEFRAFWQRGKAGGGGPP